MHNAPILALCTPRTGARFVHEACGAADATRWIVSELSEDTLQSLAERVANWGRERPQGAVVSLGDNPSLVHAVAANLEPTIPSLRGASLMATLASFNKGYCRMKVTGDLGRLKTGVLRSGDTQIPWLEESVPQTVMVKPVGGCASMGIVQTQTGSPAPKIAQVPSVLSKLCEKHLPDISELDDVVAVVEEYVPAHVPHVSVDGWVDEHGSPIPFAISDNCYIDGEAERFCHQMFPTHLSEQAQEACWKLYKSVVARLAQTYELRSQFCDVEMFVYDQEQEPRAEVMEVNCRVHPNISPVLRVCLEGADVFGAHCTPPKTLNTRGGKRAAGALYYLWSEPYASKRPDPQEVAKWEQQEDVLACIFDDEGPKSNGRICWGWLYVFASSPEQARILGERVRSALMGSQYSQYVHVWIKQYDLHHWNNCMYHGRGAHSFLSGATTFWKLRKMFELQ